MGGTVKKSLLKRWRGQGGGKAAKQLRGEGLVVQDEDKKKNAAARVSKLDPIKVKRNAPCLQAYESPPLQ
jgi:hypothetical protein